MEGEGGKGRGRGKENHPLRWREKEMGRGKKDHLLSKVEGGMGKGMGRGKKEHLLSIMDWGRKRERRGRKTIYSPRWKGEWNMKGKKRGKEDHLELSKVGGEGKGE